MNFFPCFSRVTVVLILLIALIDALSPSSTNYLTTTTELFGKTYNYTIINLKYDEPIYKINHVTCPCRNESEVKGPWSRSVPEVPEGVIFLEDVMDWNFVEMGPEDLVYLAFSTSQLPAGSSFVIDVNQGMNGVFVYAGFGIVPTDAVYDIGMVSWDTKIVVCESDWYYNEDVMVYLLLDPSANSLKSSAKIRVRTFEIETCDPDVELGVDVNGNIGLTDGVAFIDLIDPYQYKNFHLKVNSCSDKIAVWAKSIDPAITNADFDMYFSLEDTTPTTTNYTWAGFNNGPDKVVITNLCSDNRGPFSVYFSIYAFGSDSSIKYEIIATTAGVFYLDNITEYGINSYYINLISSAQLNCGGERNLYCEFFPYAYCENDPFRCCTSFFPVFPAETGSNPLLMYIESDFNLQIFLKNNLNIDPFPTMRENTISFGILNSISSANTYEQYFFDDPTQCSLTITNYLTDANADPIEGSDSLTPFAGTCDRDKLNDFIETYDVLIDELESSSNLISLTENIRSISYMSFDENWLACVDTLNELTVLELQVIDEYHDLRMCMEYEESTEYSEDPCCDLTEGVLACCVPKNITTMHELPISIDNDYIQESCSMVQCAQQSISDHINNQGCDSVDEISLDIFTFTKLYECRVSILGEKGIGAECDYSSDCLYDSICQNGLCDNPFEDLLTCVSESLNDKERQHLFLLWGVRGIASLDRFIAELENQHVSDYCVGEDSFRFREHWEYAGFITCTDECSDTYGTLACFEPFCDVPDICLTGGENSCYRDWHIKKAADEDKCEEEMECNWMTCDSLTSEECESACLEVSLTENVCLSCFRGECDVVNATDQNSCTGVCTIDGIEDESSCLLSGTCSIPCVGCDQQQCEQTQICSSSTILDPVLGGEEGLCIFPFTFGIFSTINCAEGKYVTGCKSSYNQSECLELFGEWHEPLTLINCETEHFSCGGQYSFSEEECNICSYPVVPVYQVINGEWTPGIWRELEWVPRQYKSTRTIGKSLDFLSLYEDFEKSKIPVAAFTFASEYNCEYSAVTQAIAPVLCDCTFADSNCYVRGLTQIKSAVVSACVNVDEIFNLNSITTLGVYADTIPVNIGCNQLSASSLSVEQFAVNEEFYLSSALFTAQRKTKLSVVTNTDNQIIGQLTVNGIVIKPQRSFTGNMTICIIDDTVYDEGTLPGLASYTDGKFNIVNTLTEGSGSPYCFNITGLGTYFLVRLDSDWDTRRTHSAETNVVVILYIICLILAFIQYTRSRIYDPDVLPIQRFCNFVCVVLIAGTRAVYISLPETSIGVTYALFEGPSLLFFTEYSVLLGIWGEFLIRTQKIKVAKTAGFKILWGSVIIFNILMVLMFISFVLSFTFGSSVEPDICSLTEVTVSESTFYLNKIYLTVLIGISVITIATFIIIGYNMLSATCQLIDKATKKRGTLLISILTSVFTLLLVPRIFTYVYYSWGGIPIPILFLGIVEALILLTLIINLQSDVLFHILCIEVPDRSNSSSKKNSFNSQTGGKR